MTSGMDGVSARHHRHVGLGRDKERYAVALITNIRDAIVMGWNEVEANIKR